MGTRVELQSELENKLGSRNVYFQPPENIKIKYPGIVYEYNPLTNVHANDRVYIQRTSYRITVISPNPLEPCVHKISEMPTCRHVQHYVSDNLYHDVFNLYY